MSKTGTNKTGTNKTGTNKTGAKKTTAKVKSVSAPDHALERYNAVSDVLLTRVRKGDIPSDYDERIADLTDFETDFPEDSKGLVAKIIAAKEKQK